MSEKKDGGPAIPCSVSVEKDRGMSLRDYFAGQALAGLCADPSIQEGGDDLADRSYRIADAMLAEREK